MKRVIVGLAAILGFSISAMAGPVVNLGSNWLTYDEVIGVGNFYAETWNATIAGRLEVTDYAVVGDAAYVYVNGGLVLATPVVADWSTYGPDPFGAAEHYTIDPNVAWADPAFSSGWFPGIAVGDQITVMARMLPLTFNDSTVALRIVVPEPATVFLVGGLLGLALLRRRKA